jgi:aminomethyltransferase
MAELWNLILDDKNAKPAGLGARDTLRLEMCYPLYGQDIDISVNPIEAGLDRFVDLSKDFIGKSALLTAKKNAAGKRLICLSTGSRRSPRHEFDIFYDGENVGKVTSGSFSPSLSVGIGMGYINTERVGAGREVTLSGNNISLTASISDKPLYKNGTARKD